MNILLYFYTKICKFSIPAKANQPVNLSGRFIINKQIRQRHIRELILSKAISSQEELSQELKRMGIEVTQATLSRDLHELRIVRMPEEHGFRYVIHENSNGQQIRKVVQQEILQILHNEHCIIIKTLPGRAAGVGVYLDSLKHPNILGTVAGNDTLLVIPASVHHTESLVQYLRKLDHESVE
ncbi:MAG: arginine repressor [candidate division KSB1 bacterium]|nr:arginine repressor [candidate division KSB1 bacterium]